MVSASRDLPMPGSAEISTTQPSPPFACSQRRSSRSISSPRPTSGVVLARSASNRLSAALAPSACHAGTASAKPLSSTVPRSRYSNRPPICRRVLDRSPPCPARRAPCRRAARFGVSPTASCSWADPGADRLADHDKSRWRCRRAPAADRRRRSCASAPPRPRRARPARRVRHRARGPPASRNRPAPRRPCTWR